MLTPRGTITRSADGVVVSTETVNGNGDYTSDSYTPTQAGTYRWRAFYSGDANNNAVSGACNARTSGCGPKPSTGNAIRSGLRIA